MVACKRQHNKNIKNEKNDASVNISTHLLRKPLPPGGESFINACVQFAICPYKKYL